MIELSKVQVLQMLRVLRRGSRKLNCGRSRPAKPTWDCLSVTTTLN